MKAEHIKILVVDDEPHVRELLTRWLKLEGYETVAAENGEDALQNLTKNKFHLVISDIMMPGMSGVDLLMAVRVLYPDVAVIMVTAVDDRKTAIMTLEQGAYGYVIKPFDRNEILINVANALERRRLNLLSQEYEHTLEATVELRTREVREREEEIIFRLLSATGYRDDETGAHVRRIGLYAAAMARALAWPPVEVAQIRLAAPMHDLGKIGIPDSILRKPGSLTREEFEVIKKHTEIGDKILERSRVPLLQMAQSIALSHHERWDGSGYPQGLVGEAIPTSAGITAVVDVYDALIHDRVYRPALSENEALKIINLGGRAHFGPQIFDCFMDVLPELRRIKEEVAEEDTSANESED